MPLIGQEQLLLEDLLYAMVGIQPDNAICLQSNGTFVFAKQVRADDVRN
jgi:hypothetical protein